MSSQLSSSNASRSSKSKEFNLSGIELILGEEDLPWFKQAHIGIFLELPQIVNSVKNIDSCEMRSRENIGATLSGTNGLYRPKDQQNKVDKFLSVYGVMYFTVNYRKKS